MINSNDKIYVAGHNGMVGSAIVRKLREKGFLNIITRSSSELDLTNQQNVHNFLHDEKPDYVVISAAKVGGIYANDSYPAEFIYQNLMIESNIIHGSYLAGVNNLLFLGSSCIYPKESQQPIKEEYLLNGYLEPTNEPYAIAKIAGIKLCESYNRQFNRDYRSVMPTNLYGPGDNYHPENSHVIPALIRKFHNAKINNDRQVVVWGSGSPKREFLHVDDCADACIFLMKNYNEKQFVNVGSGEEKSIKEVAETIKQKIGFEGEINFNTTYPNGTPRKLMDVSKIHQMGWKHQISFEQGMDKTIAILEEELRKFN